MQMNFFQKGIWNGKRRWPETSSVVPGDRRTGWQGHGVQRGRGASGGGGGQKPGPGESLANSGAHCVRTPEKGLLLHQHGGHWGLRQMTTNLLTVANYTTFSYRDLADLGHVELHEKSDLSSSVSTGNHCTLKVH